MEGSIVLVGGQRKRLLTLYRKETDPAVRLILLLADGHAWALIAGVLFCSTATIARWKRQFERRGIDALLEEKRGRKESASGPLRIWAATVVRWTPKLPPSFFGLVRSRWSCEALVLVLLTTHQVRVSRETVRRWLLQEQVVWRRPRPILGRIVLHYLPAYSPDANPIERVWWRMHERVTRNHRCLDLDELLDLVFQWLAEQKTFNTECRFYPNAKAA